MLDALCLESLDSPTYIDIECAPRFLKRRRNTSGTFLLFHSVRGGDHVVDVVFATEASVLNQHVESHYQDCHPAIA